MPMMVGHLAKAIQSGKIKSRKVARNTEAMGSVKPKKRRSPGGGGY